MWSIPAVLCVILFGCSTASVLEFTPDKKLLVYQEEFLDIQVGMNDTEITGDRTIQIRLNLRDDWLTRAVLLNDTVNLTSASPLENFTVQGEFIGFAWIDFTYCELDTCSDNDFQSTNQTLEIGVLRHESVLDEIFNYVILALVIVAYLGMGCSIEIEVIKEVLKRPTAPLIGFMCQFCIMPPLTFLLGTAFNLSAAERLGMLANGSSPGGGASNMWTMLLNGDLSLSITMTLISTFASLGMFPLWMYTLGKVIMGEAEFTIPFLNILGTLMSILIPVAIGILIKLKKPEIAKKVGRMLKPLMLVFVIIVVISGLWANWFMFRLFHLKLVAASCLVPFIGFPTSALISWLLRQPPPRIITICIETGIQNVGVAILALRSSLPQPTSDLSIVGAICPPTFNAPPLFAFFLVQLLYRRCWTRSRPSPKRNDPPTPVDPENGEAMKSVSENRANTDKKKAKTDSQAEAITNGKGKKEPKKDNENDETTKKSVNRRRNKKKEQKKSDDYAISDRMNNDNSV